jgi:hypothetical protein
LSSSSRRGRRKTKATTYQVKFQDMKKKDQVVVDFKFEEEGIETRVAIV